MESKSASIKLIQPNLFSDVVESYSFYELEEETSLFLNPEGNIELVFQLDGSFAQKSIDSDEWNVRPQNFVGGLHSKSFHIKSLNEKGRLMSIRFKPHGARHILPDKMNLYKNQIVNLEDLGIQSDQLFEAATENKEVVSQIEKWLGNIKADRSSSFVDYVLAMLESSKGFVSMKAISEKLNVSLSHLRLRFNEEVGMSPKEYSKILRINYIVDQLKSIPKTKLTEFSHSLGYFDQAHFIKDFKSVTGLTPTQYRKLELGI